MERLNQMEVEIKTFGRGKCTNCKSNDVELLYVEFDDPPEDITLPEYVLDLRDSYCCECCLGTVTITELEFKRMYGFLLDGDVIQPTEEQDWIEITQEMYDKSCAFLEIPHGAPEQLLYMPWQYPMEPQAIVEQWEKEQPVI
jgi:hypothetical protein